MQKCCPKGFISGKGNTTGIRPWTQEKYYHMRVLLTEEVSFEWSRHRISYTDSKVRNKYEVMIVSYESTAEEVLFEW